MFDYWERKEEVWEDYFAKDDAIRERYASELEDLKADDLQYEWWEEYMTKVWDAGFGDDHEAYEAYWKRTLEYFELQRY